VSRVPKVALIALNAHYAHTSLAIRLLRAVAVEQGFPAEHILLCEWTINDLPHQLLQRLYALDADIYAFSCSIWNRTLVGRLSRELGQVRPQATILWGGPEASQDAVRILETIPEVQAIIAGEGEMAWSLFLRAYTNRSPFGHTPDLLPGLVWRQPDGQIRTNPAAPLLNPSQWPFPWDPAELIALKDRLLYFETSRGCPYGCTYCLSSLDRTVRLMPNEPVTEAFSRLIEAGVRQVKLVDRTFNIQADRARMIWQWLIERHRQQPFATNFHFEIMADQLDEASLDLLATAPPGLIQFEIGVQTSNPRVLRAIHRPCDWPRLVANVTDLGRRTSIHLHLDLIAGLPGETLLEFAQSFNDVFALKPHQLQLGFLKVLPGSPMQQTAVERRFRWSAEPPYEILESDALSFAELSQLKDIESVLDIYHNSGRYQQALACLLTRFDTAFFCFDQLARAYRQAGWFDRQPGQAARADFLLDFGRRLPGMRFEVFLSRLKLDYLLQGAKDQPVFLDCLDNSGEPERQALRHFGREAARQMNPRLIRFRIEDFSLDSPIQCPGGSLPAGASLACFDLSGASPRLAKAWMQEEGIALR
jgi:radical SAM superfamily enzyme YgiQ (UPF0313 family)